MSPEEGEGTSPDPVSPIPPYASTRLIAYIGNKRALLPYLRGAFASLEDPLPGRRFLDPFAGSGSVARLARSMGYRVMASDAEEYSEAVNACWLGISAEEAPSLFGEEGGTEALLSRINRFHPERGDEEPPGPGVEPYIARHYAPADTGLADWRRERLFYTRENAVFLDRARSYIEALRPRGSQGRAAKERALLLGCLVYEAATHANTSGVFKAFHKGFGGHGRDALGRIMAAMELETPLLWPGEPAELGRGEAAAFCASRPAELCYLDPPYNQHQYGSNYHLLNTLARWDRPPVSEERWPDGSLLRKAGIPPSWKESRSAFCSRKTASAAFRELLGAVDARFILLSYNSEAFVPPEELYDLLSEGAEVELRSVDYVKYRGGRQSEGRSVRNREMLFMARRRGPKGSGSRARAAAASGPEARAARATALAGLEAELALSRALSSAFDPARLGPLADAEGRVVFGSAGGELRLPTYRLLLLEPSASALCEGLGPGEKAALAALLEQAAVEGNREACEACLVLLESGCRDRRLQDLALGRLRKIAHRKYGEAFEALSGRLAELAEAGGLERLAAKLGELSSLYEARRGGR